MPDLFNAEPFLRIDRQGVCCMLSAHGAEKILASVEPMVQTVF